MDLCTALGVRPGEVIALVGGGGKTTALYRLGAELTARGLASLLCGTTRFTPPAHGDPPNLTLVPSQAALLRALDPVQSPGPAGALTAATGWGSKGRLLPLEPTWLDAAHAALPGLVIVIEADGSAMRPFKAPAAHEPVIPACASVVACVVGVDAVGKPLDHAHVHRAERVAAITGATLGETVTPDLVARTLLHPEGGQKAVPPGARWLPLLNKADTPARRAAAEQIAAELQSHGQRSIIAQLNQEAPVLRSTFHVPR